MVAACDFAIASDRAEFGFPEVQIGVPTIQGAIRMPKKVAWHHAMELLLIGDRVDAQRAKEMGLVWQVVEHERLLDEARALAERLCKGAPLAVRATKEVAHRGQELPFVQAIRFGETMRRVARETTDAKEGPVAYREKRPADWKAQLNACPTDRKPGLEALGVALAAVLLLLAAACSSNSRVDAGRVHLRGV